MYIANIKLYNVLNFCLSFGVYFIYFVYYCKNISIYNKQEIILYRWRGSKGSIKSIFYRESKRTNCQMFSWVLVFSSFFLSFVLCTQQLCNSWHRQRSSCCCTLLLRCLCLYHRILNVPRVSNNFFAIFDFSLHTSFMGWDDEDVCCLRGVWGQNRGRGRRNSVTNSFDFHHLIGTSSISD